MYENNNADDVNAIALGSTRIRGEKEIEEKEEDGNIDPEVLLNKIENLLDPKNKKKATNYLGQIKNLLGEKNKNKANRVDIIKISYFLEN